MRKGGLPVTPCSLCTRVLPHPPELCHIRLNGAPPLPQSKRLGAGVIDGRGAWADQGTALSPLCALRDRLGADQRIAVQASAASLLLCLRKS